MLHALPIFSTLHVSTYCFSCMDTAAELHAPNQAV